MRCFGLKDFISCVLGGKILLILSKIEGIESSIGHSQLLARFHVKLCNIARHIHGVYLYSVCPIWIIIIFSSESFCMNLSPTATVGPAVTSTVDMNLFKTKTLIRQCGDHDVETREQVHQTNSLSTCNICRVKL